MDKQYQIIININTTKLKMTVNNYLADQGPLAHLPMFIASLSSLYELTSTILLKKNNEKTNERIEEWKNTREPK